MAEKKKKKKKKLKKKFKKKKKIYFACENLKVTNNIEMKEIDTIWNIRKNMKKFNINEIYKIKNK